MMHWQGNKGSGIRVNPCYPRGNMGSHFLKGTGNFFPRMARMNAGTIHAS